MTMTECNQDRFEFASAHGRREIVAEFSGGTVSSDGGALLLQECGGPYFLDKKRPLP